MSIRPTELITDNIISDIGTTIDGDSHSSNNCFSAANANNAGNESRSGAIADDEYHDELSVEISPIEGYSEIKMLTNPFKISNNPLSPLGSVNDDFDLTEDLTITTAANDGLINNNKTLSSPSQININSANNFEIGLRSLSSSSGSINAISDNSSTNNLSDIPQWKRDLIQRRKQNIARTIGANQSVTTATTTSMTITSSDGSPNKKVLNDVIKNGNSSFIELKKPSDHNTTTNSANETATTTTPIPKQRKNINNKNKTTESTTTITETTIENSSTTSSNSEKQQQLLQQELLLQTDMKPQQENKNFVDISATQLNSKLETNSVVVGGTQINNNSIINGITVVNENNCNNGIQLLKCGFDNQQQQQGFIKNSIKTNSSAVINKYIKNSTSGSSINKYSQSSSSSSSSSSATTSPPKKNMVAEVLITTTDSTIIQPSDVEFNEFDTSEELKYGPGIVSKLRCRYLSLALRQTNGRQKRPLLIDTLRRATSLNNLLDGGGSTGTNDDHSCTDDADDENEFNLNPANKNNNFCINNIKNINNSNNINTILNNKNLNGNNNDDQDDEFINNGENNLKKNSNEILNGVATFPSGNTNFNFKNSSCLTTTTQQSGKTVYIQNQEKNSDIKRNGRQVKRGNDSLKRARSVEALLCEKSSWLLQNQQTQPEQQQNIIANSGQQENTNVITNNKTSNGSNKRIELITPPPIVTIEDKIHNARERISSDTKNYPPKRITSIIDDTERPPPDLVKQTLKLFEASANRRGSSNLKRNQNSQVAAKVANYKSIISHEKPPVIFPKPPAHSPKRAGLPKKPNTLDIKPKIVKKVISQQNPSSPISSLTKKFEELDGAAKTPSPTSLSPGIFRQSTPLRAPDLIPRKHFEDSPIVANLAKQIERLKPIEQRLELTISESEGDSIDGDEELRIKRVSKTALDNISKAGTTQHFSFGKSDSPKQIGVIRPLIAEPKEELKLNNSNDSLKDNHNNSNNNSLSNNITNNKIEKNVSELKQQQNLTTREIEKNFINEKKNELANLEAAAAAAAAAAASTNNSPISWQNLANKKKIGSTTSVPGSSSLVEAQNNCMVFNFKDRKDVPDYIENDGLLFKRKRELPKPNESGFVLLGDLSLETSTDTDDSWAMGPPSPCDVEFENANIIIDGKSSIRHRLKESLRVQFDDTLTSTFEYPSELSLIDDSTTDSPTIAKTDYNDFLPIDSVDQVEEILQIPATSNNIQQQQSSVKSLGNMSLEKKDVVQLKQSVTINARVKSGSGLIGNYTPIKAQIQSNFELGITRLPKGTEYDTDSDKIRSNNDCVSNILNGIHESNGYNEDSKIEPDSLQYIKPATEDLTIYSEGTQKSDLLY